MTEHHRGANLPAMRVLWMVVVVVLVGFSGCRKRVPEAQVFVPNTPEGNECRRQCMVVRASCAGGRGVNENVCRQREKECLITCPGAVVGDRRTRSSRPDPATQEGGSDEDMPTR